MASTTLNLGGVEFQDLEIPAEISGLAGTQMLAVHKFPGGARTIDAMGRDYPPISWSGLFFGSTAVARAQAVEALLNSGQAQTLTWGAYNYTVIVREFAPVYQQSFQIPYRISCEVVSDNSAPVASAGSVTSDDAINTDLDTAETLSADVDDATLTGLMATLSASVGTVASFASAPQSVIASILQPLSAVQGQVSTLLATSDDTLGAAAGFGGIVAGGNASAMAADLEDTESAALAEYQLLELQGVLGRMSANLNSLNGSPNTLAVAGGNLFQIAAEQYGDAMDWTSIATANGLTDPFIQAPTVLTLPLSPTDNGGVLSN